MHMQDRLYDKPQTLQSIATDANFDEACYLRANPDVAAAVRAHQFESGRQHFEAFGRQERRRLQLKVEPGRKRSKLQQIRRLIRDDMQMQEA